MNSPWQRFHVYTIRLMLATKIFAFYDSVTNQSIDYGTSQSSTTTRLPLYLPRTDLKPAPPICSWFPFASCRVEH